MDNAECIKTFDCANGDHSDACPVKPWLKQPGELYDIRGVPIYPGDLIRSFHFMSRRRQKKYLYHTAVFVDGGMRFVPTSHLEPTKAGKGGSCLASQDLIDDNESEVISGYGPGDCLDYTDRPKRTGG